MTLDKSKVYLLQKRLYVLAFLLGLVLMSFKFIGYEITNSKAILSDALESIINVISAFVGFLVITVSTKPADRNHPYGHGKIEYFSAAFEGALIFFAAVFIIIESIDSLYRGVYLRSIDIGVLITASAGLVNAIVGLYLQQWGRKSNSLAMQASGKHLLSDFWTSVGLVAGLLLVRWTNWVWIDPALAILVACYLLYNGGVLIRESIGKLMDEGDMSLIQEIGKLFSKFVTPGIIQIHHTRVLRSGQYHHIDAHVVVPEFWDVSKAHDETDDFERRFLEGSGMSGEMHLHLDPCRRAYCRVCTLNDCPIRVEAFQKREPFSIEELLNPEEPEEYKKRGKPLR